MSFSKSNGFSSNQNENYERFNPTQKKSTSLPISELY